MTVREAAFALRIVKRKQGAAAIIYRRSLNPKGEERLTRIASIGPLRTLPALRSFAPPSVPPGAASSLPVPSTP